MTDDFTAEHTDQPDDNPSGIAATDSARHPLNASVKNNSHCPGAEGPAVGLSSDGRPRNASVVETRRIRQLHVRMEGRTAHGWAGVDSNVPPGNVTEMAATLRRGHAPIGIGYLVHHAGTFENARQ
jgi:hypothetical protein